MIRSSDNKRYSLQIESHAVHFVDFIMLAHRYKYIQQIIIRFLTRFRATLLVPTI